jgi:RNA polymerase sigma factor (sigma-70 family)
MNTQMMNPRDVSDADLVEQSRAGVTAAFGRLVERHQSLVCSVALGACGDLHRSEDIAQEAFVGAWRQLGELKEPGSFRSWVCGIARNIVNSSIRRDDRTPTALAGEASGEEVQVEAATPADHAIDSEERAILLRQLQDLPPLYREPMVLFYRQNESVASVAEVLGISEDAVKQRLSRGRVMLAERVERSLGAVLRRSAPGGAFTLAVMGVVASIPAPAAAATAGGSLAKAAAGTSAGGMIAPMVALAGVTGGLWNIMKGLVDDARSTGEGRFMGRSFMWMTAVCIVLGLMVGILAAMKPSLAVLLRVGTPVVTGLLAWPLGLWIKRRRDQLRRQDGVVSEGQAYLGMGPAAFRRSIAGVIVAGGFFPAFSVGLLGLVSHETPEAVVFGFLAACAGIVLVSTAVIWQRPSRYRVVLLAHFASLWAATLVVALFMRQTWLASGQWEENQLHFSMLIGLPLAALTITWLAWSIYIFRQKAQTKFGPANVVK